MYVLWSYVKQQWYVKRMGQIEPLAYFNTEAAAKSYILLLKRLG